MKKTINKLMQAFMVLPLFALVATTVVPVATASAAPASKPSCDTSQLDISSGADCAYGNKQPTTLFDGNGSVFTTVTNILLFLVGAISVIMLIIGGIRYVISGGDQGQVTSAKNTILYAIIGIVIAFLAYAAVAFVTSHLSA